jgi:hypothetical protein
MILVRHGTLNDSCQREDPVITSPAVSQRMWTLECLICGRVKGTGKYTSAARSSLQHHWRHHARSRALAAIVQV